ncbi:MAG: D-alanine--D-alanine ligase [Ignavibacteria bacterium]|nr:D-alanine--D-alanine ligase [Ignavibacteria bacterium]
MRIALIVGGYSAERYISLASGKSLLKALRENNHDTIVIDPIYGSDILDENVIFSEIQTNEYPPADLLEKLKKETQSKIFRCLDSDIFKNIDLAFIGLHGKFGEDGIIQALFEAKGIIYTGSGVIASGLAMDKSLSKIIFRHYGVPTPDWITISKKNITNPENLFSRIKNEIGIPFVVKPADEGSTVGLTIIFEDKFEVFITALELATSYSSKIIFEKYIKGREITVPIIGDKAYPVIEVKPKNGYYDFKHKYTKGMTEYICPAEISDHLRNKVQELGLKAHNSIGCEVYSRVDFIVDEKDNTFCLEVNTLPGMTELSLVPKSAAVFGENFNELVEKIIKLSLNKL